ncbi:MULTISPECIES: hypothetical protein [unclassified Lysobacter]|uniref:hypothetical protein n=1 Tax=unclassified Lysobacter TaxID=2635362 RepID=UPI001C241865|nr:hypothetical protein [Lysobacter sp. MMG2]MBU8974543.1 hypothetical protein [Lysobacter sp. MMG2]
MSESTKPCPPAEPTEPRCTPFPTREPPKLPDPIDCPVPCCCPPGPGGNGGSCLDSVIAAQSQLADKAAMAKDFADELRALQDKMVAARAGYTREKFTGLSKRWNEQDAAIGKLASDVACSVSCWECLLECRLCPLLYEIRTLERRLNGYGNYPTSVDTLRELASWHERNRDDRQAVYDRIKAVLAAWEDPATTLDEVLTANQALLDSARAQLSTDPAAAIYTLFVKLIPAHWAIRPRGEGMAKPKVEPYAHICTCGNEDPDECCGPDTSAGTVIERLRAPLPYLIDPNGLADLLCCLVTERYLPAKELLAEAHALLENAKQDLERTAAQIKSKTEALEASFMAELSGPIDCGPYRKKNGKDDPCTPPTEEPEEPKPCPPAQPPCESDTPKQSGA